MIFIPEIPGDLSVAAEAGAATSEMYSFSVKDQEVKGTSRGADNSGNGTTTPASGKGILESAEILVGIFSGLIVAVVAVAGLWISKHRAS